MSSAGFVNTNKLSVNRACCTMLQYKSRGVQTFFSKRARFDHVQMSKGRQTLQIFSELRVCKLHVNAPLYKNYVFSDKTIIISSDGSVSKSKPLRHEQVSAKYHLSFTSRELYNIKNKQ